MLWGIVQHDDGAGLAVQEDHSIANEANSTLPISLDGATSLDETIRLTIADMPNALRLLENS